MWLCTPVIPETQEVKVVGSWFEVSQGKSTRPCLKIRVKAKRTGTWLKK
jgi:hypothetical protein